MLFITQFCTQYSCKNVSFILAFKLSIVKPAVSNKMLNSFSTSISFRHFIASRNQSIVIYRQVLYATFKTFEALL